MSDGTVTYSGANAMSSNGGTGIRNISNGGFSNDDIIARVTFILLDDSDKKKFDLYGGWKNLGIIECVIYINGADSSKTVSAKPSNPNHTRYPLLNELVILKKAVSYKSQGAGNNYSPDWYYTDIVPTSGGVEHNATPDSNLLKNTTENKVSYKDTTSGNVKKNNSSSVISITGIFNDTGKINKLINNPGDDIIQGRSGNSIRLGSSISGFNSPFVGPNRSPIIAIVNGHATAKNTIPIFENVNKDGSSFYALNKHNIGFIPSALNFDSHNQTINNEFKNNYIEPNVSTINPVSSSLAAVDNAKPVVDSTPAQLPVSSSSSPSSINVPLMEDEIMLPDRETNTQSTQEIEDVIDLTESVNELNTSYIPPTVVVTKKTVSGTPFEIQINSYYCLVAASSMVLRSFGINTNQNILGNFVDSSHLFHLDKATQSYNKKLFRVELSGNDYGYNMIISKFNSLKRPFILQKRSLSQPDNLNKSHFVVVVGISSDGKIIVNDPGRSRGKENPISISDLKPYGGSLRIIN